jgi:hypothetical protein
LFTAWNTARMSTFHGGKLKSFSDELEKLHPRPKRQQTNEEIIAAMRAIRETMAPKQEETNGR